MVRGSQVDENPSLNHFKILVRAGGLSDEQWEDAASFYYGDPQNPNNSVTKSGWIYAKNTRFKKIAKDTRNTRNVPRFATICPLCKCNKHTSECNKNAEEAKEVVRREAVKYFQIKQAKQKLLREESKVKRQRVAASRQAAAALRANANTAAAAGPAGAVCCEQHDEEDHVCEPDSKRTPDQKATDRYVKELVYSYYHTRVKPMINPPNSRFLLPNPQVLRSRTARQVYGQLRVPIPEHQEAAIHLYLADRQLVIVSPRVYFPHDWHMHLLRCPHCDLLPSQESGYECQGLIYLPRQVYGIGSERLWMMGDVYCHINCSGKKKRQFTVTNPKVMAQFSPIPAAAYDFIVRQRTVFTRDMVEHDALFRTAGVGAQTVVNVNQSLETARRTKLETGQAVAEVRVREPGKPGEICFSNSNRDTPVQLLRSVLHGTYTGRVPGVHAMNLAFIALMFVLSPFYVAAMERLSLFMLAIDQTFKIAKAIKQRGVGKLDASYSNMCTAMNENREVVLAYFAKDKTHDRQDSAMDDLAARARRKDPEGIGIRTVVSDNPEADFSWLRRKFGEHLQVLGDAFHYLQDFGKAATKRSSKVGLWAMAVSSSFWVANEDDVAADNAWREKQRGLKKKAKGKRRKKGKHTGKSNPNYTGLYGKNPHVRHVPASKEQFLASLERAKDLAKNALKIPLNFTKLEAATDRIKAAFHAGFLDEPVLGSYTELKAKVRSGFLFVTNRGSSVLEAFHRVLRRIVQAGSSCEIQTHYTLLPFVYLYNERRRAKNENDAGRVIIIDCRINNDNSEVYDQLENSLNPAAREKFIEMNKWNPRRFWTFLSPCFTNTMIGGLRVGSDSSWNKALQTRLDHMLSAQAEDEDDEHDSDDDNDDDDASAEFREFERDCAAGLADFRRKPASPINSVIPSHSSSRITIATRSILRSMHNHLRPKLKQLPLSSNDSTVYKPTPVQTDHEVLLFSILFDSNKFVKKRDKFENALLHDPHMTLSNLAYKTVKATEGWRMEDMADWWCLQVVQGCSAISAGFEPWLTPSVVVVKGGELKWTDNELEKMSKIDISKVFLKDKATLTSHMSEHAKRMLRTLGPGTDSNSMPFMEIGETTHDLAATFARLTKKGLLAATTSASIDKYNFA